MEMDESWFYFGDHFIIHKTIESLCYTLETNIILYVNYNSIKKRKHISKDEESCSWDGDWQGETDWLGMYVELINLFQVHSGETWSSLNKLLPKQHFYLHSWNPNSLSGNPKLRERAILSCDKGVCDYITWYYK